MNRSRTARPTVIAVDGRSGAGKTSLAVELAAALREHRSVALVHLEDLYPGWDGLALGVQRCAAEVLGPLRRGETARWRAWDWEMDTQGDERVTEPADVVVLEGVGAGSAELRALADALVWVEAPAEDRKRRALDRDGETYAPHWERWAASEDEWFAADDTASSAAVTIVAGADPIRPEGTTARVVAALAELPVLRGALAPERAARESGAAVVRRLPTVTDPEALFEALFGAASHAVWLDSSDAGTEGAGPRSRFSIMADDGGARGRRAVHRAGLTEVTFGPGSATPTRALFEEPFFRWLDTAWGRGSAADGAAITGLECGFALGWLGYLGYELKRESGGNDMSAGSFDGEPIPDAELVFAARAVVVDHERGETWLLALESPDADAWLDVAERTVLEGATERAPRHAVPDELGGAAALSPVSNPDSSAPRFTARDSPAAYRDKVRLAKAEIAEGNTYEVCLTTTLEAELPAPPVSERAVDPWAAYRGLRRRSPAPFAAFARFGRLAVASTSPERFVSLTAEGALRAEPIKGTRRRAVGTAQEDEKVRAELAANPKDRAENLMIVDLLRNDLSHFAVPGSVAVSRLFAVETYATVHQLVSTIDARLRPGASRAEAVAAAFPPGSMTGAPKISTMAILDRLEVGPRGIYSGVIGYFSRNGAADLSVVIRTLIVRETADGAVLLTLGVGGAVVADSDPDDEHDEIKAKAFAVLSTLGAEFPD